MFRKILTGLLLAVCLSPAFAQRSDCATPGADGNRIIADKEVVNAYYTGNNLQISGDTLWLDQPAAQGVQTIPFGGALLLVIQVQGAEMVIPDDPTNPAYGAGNPEQFMQGWDSNKPLQAGQYEYVTIKSVQEKAGRFRITLNQPLQYQYFRAEADTDHRPEGGLNNKGQGNKRYQIVLIPQYQNLTLNGGGEITCPPWDGETGGIVAIDINGYLLVPAGATAAVTASGRGFRGGGAHPAEGHGEPDWIGPSGDHEPDVQHGSRDEAYAPLSANRHGIKGEGICGTPAVVYQPLLAEHPVVLPRDSYPGGSAGRGAPGNAGGGGTDADDDNEDNAGGGGGSNIGAGGKGGHTADSERPTGGLGGAPLTATPERLLMGGGGGGGSATPEGMKEAAFAGSVSGAPGGGIVALSVRYLTVEPGAVLTLSATGASALPATNCGGGGGGAGGTILLLTKNAEVKGSLNAHAGGGNGANTTHDKMEYRFGPGGGGGGGVVYATIPFSATSVQGAPAGSSLLAGQVAPYGATTGQHGIVRTPPVLSKVITGFECVPLDIQGITPDNLRAYLVDGHPRLFWSLTGPDADADFEIQRSYNGSIFDSLTNTRIETSDHQQFSCIDGDALPTTGATLYYRVRYENASGGYWFSPIAELAADQVFLAHCTAAPNPTRETIALRYDLGSKPAQVLLYDLSGKLVQQHSLDPLQNSASFSAPTIGAGTYLLKIIAESPEFSGTLFSRLVIY